MTLKDLGYNSELEKYRKENNLYSFDIGRITLEHKDRYIVKTATSEFNAELIGNIRFTAESKYDLPHVGDWVAISKYDDDKALIYNIYPRSSVLERKAVAKLGKTQIIATNIDFGLIVQSINRDFNINRIERYLTICHSANIKLILVLSKIDLIEKSHLDKILDEVNKRIKNTSIFTVSNQSKIGIDNIKSQLKKGKTFCLLGSSGVGKSSLINNLVDKELMNTGEISETINRGKHITTHRELLVSENGILIDNPGMREVGISNDNKGLEITFDEIVNLSYTCKFNDCSHTNEKGCAILKAIENKEIDTDSYTNFQKMSREKDFFDLDVTERKKKDKNLGKMIKNVQKQKRRDKY